MKGVGIGDKTDLRMLVKITNLWYRELNKGPESNGLPKGVVGRGNVFVESFKTAQGSDGEDW